MSEQIIEQIKSFADQAHGDQKRKYTPDRYIVHPIRVMEICREYTKDVTILAAALLHDVLEDTETSEAELLAFLKTVMPLKDASRTLALVVELTDVYIKSNYPKWNRAKRKQMEAQRIAQTSRDSQTVKYADIMDNALEILPYDRDFGKKFLQECRSLLAVAKKGNPVLRDRALNVVNDGLATFQH
ncbi:MAG TPA: HD domain-containing protein [Pseudosphingobacterium sp.]|nr:HD domain-containing protein [Pseudosphingobacterium sp.]